MSGTMSCKSCGGSEFDTDPARGDTVCTSCGTVIEQSIIVSEITFEEDGHGGASAVGQFVSAESRGGGASGAITGFHTGVAKESREITLRTGKKKIQEVAQLLRLNQNCIDMAYNFFKMALHKQLTKGRKHALTIAACVYMTCRIEATPHLLIDFSDVVQMDVYALGRAFIQISRSLFINIPAVDPCMYILRFAHKFELEGKTHEVAMTALRLVQRMKRDWIHLGRRPSGLCGAALLIAARLHGFSRTVQDVIKIVKVHETTLRKRLVEFGETPSSSLTLDEFMSVDLEEEHDPPSFKAARMKDREQLQKLMDEEVSQEFVELQRKIDEELEKRQSKAQQSRESAKLLEITDGKKKDDERNKKLESREVEDATRFIVESTITTINSIIDDKVAGDTNHVADINKISDSDSSTTSNSINHNNNNNNSSSSNNNNGVVPKLEKHERTKKEAEEKDEQGKTSVNELLGPLKPDSETALAICDIDRILMPPPVLTMPLLAAEGKPDDGDSEDEDPIEQGIEEDLLEGIDDAEIDGYIMSPYEVRSKTVLWEQLNAEYLAQQELKKSQAKPTTKENRAEKQKQRKKNQKKANDTTSTYQAKTANEAIRIMLTEKKMSSKINYDVLKTLSNDLFGSSIPSTSTGLITPKTEALKTENESKPLVTVIESGPVLPTRSMKRNLMTDDSKVTSNKKAKASKKAKVESVEEDKEHKVKLEDSKNKITIEEPKPVEEAVVIESGPVQPVTHFEDDHDSDEDEDDRTASNLLKQFRGGADDGDDDYYD